MRRSRLAPVLITATLLVSAASASVASAKQSTRVPETSSIVRTLAEPSGSYEVVVSVRATGKAPRTVHVYLTGQRVRTVVAYPRRESRLYYTVNLTSTKLTVRTTNPPPAVQSKAVVTLKQAATTAAQPAPSATTTTPTTPITPATPATATTTTPPAVITAAPTPALTSYTNLLWEDNFVQDFVNGGSAPNQLPLTSKWSLDYWGGCGTGTLSTTTPSGNPNADQNAYLTDNGLAITARKTGADTYSSAQVDTVGPHGDLKSFTTGGEIEASIALPAGQGLCPAFWMLADDPVAGASTPGEIDIMEAPAFGPLPTYADFTLHGPTGASEFENPGTPAGWVPTQFNTYGVIWTPTSITRTINGIPTATVTESDVPAGSWASYQTGAFRLIFDLAVGGWPCQIGTCTPPASATMYVQWVKVFN